MMTRYFALRQLKRRAQDFNRRLCSQARAFQTLGAMLSKRPAAAVTLSLVKPAPTEWSFVLSMNRNLPPLKSLRHFEAVARLHSFSEAAQELGITQSAISHQIKMLENFYQQKLFTRDRQVTLTPQGKLLYDAVLQSFAHLIEASELLRERARKPQLVVATISPFEPWLSDHLDFYPESETSKVHIINYPLLDKFPEDDAVDMAIVFTNSARQSGVYYQRLFAEESVPVCDVSLAAGVRGIQDVEDLHNHSLLHKRNRSLWQLWFHTMGTPYPNSSRELFFRDDIALHKALLAAEGVGLLHEDEIDESLVSPLASKIPDDFAYYLCWRDNSHKHFRDWISSEISQSRYADQTSSTSTEQYVPQRLGLSI